MLGGLDPRCLESGTRQARDGSQAAGPRTSGRPSRIRIDQPPQWSVRWWWKQTSTPLSVWVGPPRACSITWWISQQFALT